MKANKAPKKIYLFENPVSCTPDDRWLSKRSDDEDIEYTRTDVLIKKAEQWMKTFLDTHYIMRYRDSCEPIHDAVLEGFVNYMKGE